MGCKVTHISAQSHALKAEIFPFSLPSAREYVSLRLNYNRRTMQETRQNKIARLLQKELSLIFQQQTRATHGVMVSVTRTKVSPDLSICTAYLSIFPSEKGKEILNNITANEKSIRYELGTRVRFQLRIIPELRFFIDDSLDYIDRIDELLAK